MGSKFISVVSMLANVHRFLCHPDVILFRVNTRSVVQGKGSKLRLNKFGPSLKFTAPLRNLPIIISAIGHPFFTTLEHSPEQR